MSGLPINLGGDSFLMNLGQVPSLPSWVGGGAWGALVAVLLINLGGAAALALVARVVDGIWGTRWPAVAHLLWLLVLGELVVPPVLGLAILPPSEAAVASAALPAAAPVVPPAAAASSETAATGTFSGVALLCASWVASVGVALGLSARRSRCFERCASRGVAAEPHLARRVGHLARCLGLRHAPRALVVPARVPPLLWRRRRRYEVVLPAELVGRLEPAELDAVIAHELAHAVRRDPWIRWLELLVTAAFWWYPVTWWARLRLRRAEERCCDAIVVSALPTARRSYATALVKTVEFLAGHDSPLPDTASGASVTRDLQERLTMILKHRPRPRLSSLQRIVLGVAALVLLLVFPTRAQRPDDPSGAPADVELHDELAALEREALELELAQREIERRRIELMERRQLLEHGRQLDDAERTEDIERVRRDRDLARQYAEMDRARMDLAEEKRMRATDEVQAAREKMREMSVELDHLLRQGRDDDAADLERRIVAMREDFERARDGNRKREHELERRAIEAEMDRLRRELDRLRSLAAEPDGSAR